jgi:MTH538 TIR-like domain (DUF1863)
MAELYRFAAFISYSSKDASFAKRLHRALEAYGIPATLGKFDLLGGGGKPNRVYPVFRDRDELSAGRLAENIEAALKASGALIVICSTAAAASPWVNKEIEFFLSLGRQDRIFAIISGDSPSQGDGGDVISQTFPPAFRNDGLVEGGFEPIAADARKGKDGFRNAWLKVVAGLVGVNAGALFDRDRKRRRQRSLRLSIASAVVAVAAVGTLVSADTVAWRESLSVRAVALLQASKPIDAMPFALASVNLGGAAIPFHNTRGDEVLTDVGSVRLVGDLGPLKDWRVSEDGRILFTESENRAGAYYDLAGDAAPRSLGPLARHWKIDLSKNGATLVLYNEDGTGTVYDLKHGGSARSLGDLGNVLDAKLSANGLVLVVERRDYTGLYFDLARARPPVSLGQMDGPLDLHLSEDGGVLATRADAGDVSLYDLASGGAVRRFGNFGTLGARRSTANASALILRNLDGTAVRYDLSHADVPQSLGNLGDAVVMDLSEDGRALIVESTDGTATFYDLTTQDGPRPLGRPGVVLDRRFSSDGGAWVVRTLANAVDADILSGKAPLKDFDSAVTYYDLKTGGTAHRMGNLGPLRDVLIAVDGRVLIVRDLKGVTTLYSFPNETAPRTLGTVSDLHVTVDGKALLTQNIDGTSTLHHLVGWNAPRHLGKFLGDPNQSRVALSANGSIVIRLGSGSLTTTYDLAAPPPRPKGAELAADVCAMSGDVIRPFATELRDPAQSEQRKVASDQAIHAILRGRPWHPCDWRGLAAGREGWAQYWRLIKIRYLGAPDYACEERTAAGSRDAVSIARCARLRAAEAALKPD